MADVLDQFDLGETQLYPVKVFQSDREPVDGRFHCIAFAETKDTLLPERSPSLRIPPGRNKEVYRLRPNPTDDGVAVRSAASAGVDLWMDPLLEDAFFISDRLQAALTARKLTERLGLRRCVILPDH